LKTFLLTLKTKSKMKPKDFKTKPFVRVAVGIAAFLFFSLTTNLNA